MKSQADTLLAYSVAIYKKIGENSLSSNIVLTAQRIKPRQTPDGSVLPLIARLNGFDPDPKGLSEAGMKIAADMHSRLERIASICAAPDDRLTDEMRLRYVGRCMYGDVNIYRSGDVWNLWKYDVRIALCVLPGRWHIAHRSSVDEWTTLIGLLDMNGAERQFSLRVGPRIIGEMVGGYANYRDRQIESFMGHLNTFDLDIESNQIYHC